MAGPVAISVIKTGKFRKPVLDNAQLTAIGTGMVAKQKARWAAALNADDQKAKPLSKPYLYKKARIRKTNRPVRDLHLTGLLLENFRLRKAIDGIIRAEPTSRAGRQHATSATRDDQMIGFSLSDAKQVYDETERQYGRLAEKMWFQID